MNTAQTPTHESDSAGLGELLRCARERCGLTVDQISNETRIPRHHLEALERDNLTAVPGAFYRRAEIRAYARAVHLDQNLALAQLERASKPSVAPEPVPDRWRTQTSALSGGAVPIVVGIGLVLTAALFWRGTGERESAPDRDAQLRSVTDSSLRAGPVRETPPDAVVATSQRKQLDKVAPPSPSEGVLAVAETTATTVVVPSIADPAVIADFEAQTSADSVTELVVTTEPLGTRVTVNGIAWGTAPVTIRYLPPGDKTIRVSKEGYVTEERLVRLTDGHPSRLDIQLRTGP